VRNRRSTGTFIFVVKKTGRPPFVAEPIALTPKDLRFWIGFVVWIAPPLLLLVLILVALAIS
jgi:hypothetical protein